MPPDIDRLNADPAVHGILVQLPLPGHIDADRVLDRIRPDKDVDGFHPLNVGNLTFGREALVPCTPNGVVRLLAMEGIAVAGKRAVIIGRSNIVGKPHGQPAAGQERHRHRSATPAPKTCRPSAARPTSWSAAIGKPNFVTADMVKPGAVVIDVSASTGWATSWSATWISPPSRRSPGR